MIKKRKIDQELRNLIIECLEAGSELRFEAYSALFKMLKIAFWYGYRTARNELMENEEDILKWCKK